LKNSMDEREKRIQEALKKSEAEWDKRFSQSDWNSTSKPTNVKPTKHKRAGKGFAAKALRNLY
jgi:hypothetical protein